MKATIGRARESRGFAEMELMTSTSHDVCELWNGSQIVRVMGSSPMKQILCFPNLKKDHPNLETDFPGVRESHCGLYTLEEALNLGLMVKVNRE